MHNGPEIVLVLQLQRNMKILLKAIVSKEKETHKGCKKHWQTAEKKNFHMKEKKKLRERETEKEEEGHNRGKGKWEEKYEIRT